jgi:inorganic pyrophosphatase
MRLDLKDLEPGKWVKVAGWGNAAQARQLINEGIARYAADQAK